MIKNVFSPESALVVRRQDVAVVEQPQEEEGAALLPLGHALDLFHAALTSLDVSTSLKRKFYFRF